VSYRLLTPSLTAPGSVAVPVFLTGAPVGAPEVLASPAADGRLLVPVVPGLIAPSFMAPWDAPGPTLPWLDAPSVGWAFWAKAAGVERTRKQADAKMAFFI